MIFLRASPDKKFIISSFPWVLHDSIKVYTDSLEHVCTYKKHKTSIYEIDCNSENKVISTDNRQIHIWSVEGLTLFVMCRLRCSFVCWLTNDHFVFSSTENKMHKLKIKNYKNAYHYNSASEYDISKKTPLRDIVSCVKIKKQGDKYLGLVLVKATDQFYVFSADIDKLEQTRLDYVKIVNNTEFLYKTDWTFNILWIGNKIFTSNASNLLCMELDVDSKKMELKKIIFADSYILDLNCSDSFKYIGYTCRSKKEHSFHILCPNSYETIGYLKKDFQNFLFMGDNEIVVDYKMSSSIALIKFSCEEWMLESYNFLDSDTKRKVFTLLCIFKFGNLSGLSWDCFFKILQFYVGNVTCFEKPYSTLLVT